MPQPSERGPRASDQAAAAVGVSGRYVRDAKRIANEAPEIIPQIEAGDITITEAKKRIASPAPAAPRPRREALPGQAERAGWELRKATERLERLAQDDRFPTNKQQVAAHWNGHLLYAIEVCQDLYDQLSSEEG